MRRYTNPYIAGNPVGKSEAFVGRKDVLREVLRVLRATHRNAITLYGQRRIGKTSVLQWLEAHLPEHGPYVPVYFDLQDRAAKPLGQVLVELADTIALKLDLPRPQLGANSEATFHTTWLPQALEYLPQGHSLVLLFDEFDVLADPKQGQAAAEFFPYLRKLLEQDLERLQFVFVLGRNISDLSQIAFSLFKGVPAKRVPLLSRKDTEDLVRLAERNGSLRWPEASVARVWELTHGHPFLTQALCWEVWQRLHEDSPAEPPEVQPDDVDMAIEPTLEHSRNTLEWLWQGLGPAEKVVAAALAHAGPGPVTEEELVRILQESGVRLIIRELEDAPRLLQEWDIIEPADGGYRFRVELLRRWIADRYTPQSVQKELDRIEPAAENLYQAGRSLYEAGDLEGSRRFLEQALGLNPNHQRAAELLSAIYLSQGYLDKAQALLERLHDYFPSMARPRLVQIYLERAEKAEETEEKRQWYERVLAISPDHRAAREGLCRLLVQDLEALEAVQQYEQALALAEAFQERYGYCDFLQDILERLKQKARLKTMYQHALDAVERGDREEALELFKQIVQIDPRYKETTRYLHWIVTGEEDVKPEGIGNIYIRQKQSNSDVHHEEIIRRYNNHNRSLKRLWEDAPKFKEVQDKCKSGSTTLVVGLPGMGKTELLNFIERSCRKYIIRIDSGRYDTEEEISAVEWFWQEFCKRITRDWPDLGLEGCNNIEEWGGRLKERNIQPALLIDEIDLLIFLTRSVVEDENLFKVEVENLFKKLKTLQNNGFVIVATSFTRLAEWDKILTNKKDKTYRQVFQLEYYLRSWSKEEIQQYLTYIGCDQTKFEVLWQVSGGVPDLLLRLLDKRLDNKDDLFRVVETFWVRFINYPSEKRAFLLYTIRHTRWFKNLPKILQRDIEYIMYKSIEPLSREKFEKSLVRLDNTKLVRMLSDNLKELVELNDLNAWIFDISRGSLLESGALWLSFRSMGFQVSFPTVREEFKLKQNKISDFVIGITMFVLLILGILRWLGGL